MLYLEDMNNFVVQAGEQVLRFTSVHHWNDLSEERKVQLAFNFGVVALGLNLTKEEGSTMCRQALVGPTEYFCF